MENIKQILLVFLFFGTFYCSAQTYIVDGYEKKKKEVDTVRAKPFSAPKYFCPICKSSPCKSQVTVVVKFPKYEKKT